MTDRRIGYVLLEALLGIAIFGILVTMLLPTIGFLLQRSRISIANTDANLVLQQGIEVAYNVFSAHWDAYPTGTYAIAEDLTSGVPRWTLIDQPSEVVDGKFTRVIEISQVKRNPTTGISGSGDVDPYSRMVKTTVFWQQGEEKNLISADLLLIDTR
jgi:type II secretory pathway pseudopilin PulG